MAGGAMAGQLGWLALDAARGARMAALWWICQCLLGFACTGSLYGLRRTGCLATSVADPQGVAPGPSTVNRGGRHAVPTPAGPSAFFVNASPQWCTSALGMMPSYPRKAPGSG